METEYIYCGGDRVTRGSVKVPPESLKKLPQHVIESLLEKGTIKVKDYATTTKNSKPNARKTRRNGDKVQS